MALNLTLLNLSHCPVTIQEHVQEKYFSGQAVVAKCVHRFIHKFSQYHSLAHITKVFSKDGFRKLFSNAFILNIEKANELGK